MNTRLQIKAIRGRIKRRAKQIKDGSKKAVDTVSTGIQVAYECAKISFIANM